jgi:hypothetical protein
MFAVIQGCVYATIAYNRFTQTAAWGEPRSNQFKPTTLTRNYPRLKFCREIHEDATLVKVNRPILTMNAKMWMLRGHNKRRDRRSVLEVLLVGLLRDWCGNSSANFLSPRQDQQQVKVLEEGGLQGFSYTLIYLKGQFPCIRNSLKHPKHATADTPPNSLPNSLARHLPSFFGLRDRDVAGFDRWSDVVTDSNREKRLGWCVHVV